jgi:hypothetical protein
MTTDATRFPSALTRRTALGGIGVAAALSLGQIPAVAAQETAMASHPIVGAWIAVIPPDAGPAIFHADGTLLMGWSANYVDPTLGVVFQGPGIGAWEPQGERGVHFTSIQVLTDQDATFVGTFMIESAPVVSDDGMSFTDNSPESRFVLRDAQGVILSDTRGPAAGTGLTAVRITPGSMILPEATPTAGTPTS